MYIPLPFVFVDCEGLTSYPIYPLISAFNPLYLIQRNRGDVDRGVEVLGFKRLIQVSAVTP